MVEEAESIYDETIDLQIVETIFKPSRCFGSKELQFCWSSRWLS